MEIVIFEVPAFVTCAVCEVLLPTARLPNAIVVGLAVKVPGDELEGGFDVPAPPPQPLRTNATNNIASIREITGRVVELDRVRFIP